MYGIAICDNEKRDIERLRSDVIDYIKNHPQLEGEVTCFQRPEELLQALESGKQFDTYILDIMMPEIDGIQLGKKIRERNEEVPVIYITSTKEYAYQAFGVHAIEYLDKPVQQEQLARVLDKAYGIHSIRQRNRISVKSREGMVTIKTDDIMYVENVSRMAVYTMRDGTKVYSVCNRTAFEKTIEPLPQHSDFMQPHKSFFVNMRCIRIFKPYSLVLDNGIIIPVSHKKFMEAKKQYLEFLLWKGETG